MARSDSPPASLWVSPAARSASRAKSTTTLDDYLRRESLVRLLGAMAFVVLPHAFQTALWITGAVALVLVWRVWISGRQQPMPSVWIRGLLVVVFSSLVWWRFGGFSGQRAGVALLLAMTALKLTEMRSRRDVMVVVFLLFFLMGTVFLFWQALWTMLFLTLGMLLVTGVMIEASHAGKPLSPKVSLRAAGIVLLQAAPVAVILFVLFPRIPGPLWGLPRDTGADARSGLSDNMAPGDISSLALSDEVAFRVRFGPGRFPPRAERYWRGPVFTSFDGRRWTIGTGSLRQQPPPLATPDPARSVTQEIVLEPNRQPWLFALDMPLPDSAPTGARANGDDTMVFRLPVQTRRFYRVVSDPGLRPDPGGLPELIENRMTRLPPGYNPRAVALAQQWRTETSDPEALARKALAMFRKEPFRYTLRPPGLGRDSVDEFLFDTRAGFCEHYASAFTVLMRAAGVPARVVTGYQGGDVATFGSDYEIRQSDAHAWSEIWVAGKGWVRADPTAAVAPERIERGMGAALSADGEELPEDLRGRLGAAGAGWVALRYNLEARFEGVSAAWDRWFLAYGPEVQQQLLGRFGLADLQRMALALIGLVALVTGLLAGWLWWQGRKPALTPDAVLKRWQRQILKPLARRGLVPMPGEGPRDFVGRAVDTDPDLSSWLKPALATYLEERYLATPAATA